MGYIYTLWLEMYSSRNYHWMIINYIVVYNNDKKLYCQSKLLHTTEIEVYTIRQKAVVCCFVFYR